MSHGTITAKVEYNARSLAEGDRERFRSLANHEGFCRECELAKSATAECAENPGVPNIVLILADDLGYADIGVHGCKDIPTPNIDALASNGIRCTSGYVSCPYCSPTRAGFLTGRYQQRFGHEFNPQLLSGGGAGQGLPPGEVTIPQRFKDAGYATALIGKWHQGEEEKFHPLNRGFGEFFGFLPGMHS